MFSTSQHDCNIDGDETNSSNDQGICNDPETPTPNNIRKSKQKRAQQKFIDKFHTEEQLMKDVATRINEWSGASAKKILNFFFVTLKAVKVRKMPERMRCTVKNEMNKFMIQVPDDDVDYPSNTYTFTWK